MCGISAYIGPDGSAKQRVYEGLLALEYRGYDSAGMAWVTERPDGGRRFQVVKHVGRVSGLEEALHLEADGGTEATQPVTAAIGHTRWATHGEANERNCHPHQAGRVCLVHNGIIENYLELRQELEAEGHVFRSETDSEVAAVLIDANYDADPVNALTQSLPRLTGSYAFAILFLDRPGEIYCVRQSSSLLILQGEGSTLLSSDLGVCLHYSRRYLDLPERVIAVCRADTLSLYDAGGRPMGFAWQTCDWDPGESSREGFDFYMEKEIFEEPEALRRTFRSALEDGMRTIRPACFPDTLLQTCEELYFVACGTAMHAALAAKSLFEAYLRLPCRVEISSEFRYQNPLMKKTGLFIVISQSGETADSLAALRLAKSQGIPSLAIVNVPGSAIAKEADYHFLTQAGPEIAVASTKAYIVQVAAIQLLMLRMAELRGLGDPSWRRNLLAELLRQPEVLHARWERRAELLPIAREVAEREDVFFIGRGLDYALATEASLKLKEISYIHSEAYAAGELKHGTISLVTEGTPVFALATQKELFEKMRSNMKEVQSRGGRLILISTSAFPREDGLYAHRVDLDLDMPELAAYAVLHTLQILAFEVSRMKGIDVDHPRNLAKSVTVE